MNPLYTKAAAFAAMPLMAAGGYAGYNYYDTYSHQYPSEQMVCTSISQDLYYGYSNNSTDVARMQQFFVSYGYLRGRVNGQFDQATLRALQNFQNNQGLQMSGYADSATRQRIEQISCTGTNGGGYPYPNQNGQLSVQGIDAPSSLQVGQSGSFTVRVSGRTYNGGQLHYRVIWGDENTGPQATAYYGAQTVNSTGTFTHTYVTAGTYTVRFTVTDDYGHTTQATATVRVTGTTYNNGGYNNGNYNCSYYYDRNCYNSNYNGGYSNGGYNNGNYTNGGYTGGVTCASYYDRNCYSNGTYVGPNYGGGSTYNGPGDTCYFLNGYWQGNCGSSYNNGGYNNNYNGGYTNTVGGPNGPDYSCYYDRACLAQMQGRTY